MGGAFAPDAGEDYAPRASAQERDLMTKERSINADELGQRREKQRPGRDTERPGGGA
jgi:hypothetical protein